MAFNCTNDKINYFKLYQRLIFSFSFVQNRAFILWKNHALPPLNKPGTINLYTCNTICCLVRILHRLNTRLHARYRHYPLPCRHFPLHLCLHFVCFALSLFHAKYTLSIHVYRWYISLHTLLNRNGTLGSSMLKAIRSSSTGLPYFLLL